MPKVKFEKLPEALSIANNATVRVTEMGNIVEVIHVAYKPDVLDGYRKIDKEHFAVVGSDVEIEKHIFVDAKTGEKRSFAVNRETGEVIDKVAYSLNENRAQNIAGLKKTMKKIRDLINTNFTGANNELFITLTYRVIDGQPMNDVKKASIDFDRFIKRFRRKYHGLEYIAVLEPQANTAWHWHVLAKFTEWREKSHIRIDNNEIMEPLWSWGWTRTQRVDHSDNVGAYLTAYLASVEINDDNKMALFDTVYKNGCDITIEEKEVPDEDGKKVLKKFVKGGRMYLYPSGTNIYRCSKGIKKPTSNFWSYSMVKKNITDGKEPDFSRTIVIKDKENDDENMKPYNTITYEHYNMKRGKRKGKGKLPESEPIKKKRFATVAEVFPVSKFHILKRLQGKNPAP